MPPLSPREETRRNQAAAADPTASAWVSANAGTGKTHVLTLRMLRLLLAGTEPARILALTYTKAAAAEMATRVFGRLADWVTAGDEALTKALQELLGRAPTAEETKRARQLFALVIETPGGLKVQTIHAFCERLLQRFPLEAGVPPGFEILDDHTRDALLAEAADQVLTEAAKAAPGTPLGEALRRTIAYAAESNFDALLADVLRHRDWLNAQHTPALQVLADALRYREWLEEAVRLAVDSDGLRLEEAEELYRRALKLAPDASLERTDAALVGILTEAQLIRLRAVLAEGSKTDQSMSERLDAVLGAAGPDERAAALAKVFFKSDGECRTSFMTKGLLTAYPDADAPLQNALPRFVALNQQRCKLQLMEATLALVRLGSAVMQRYVDAKRRHAQLDFDDLVASAASLLRSSDSVAWVLFKLDGGLDHILVDEAQDTSPVQWKVITALAEEFFSGIGAREEPRTLFAVGDEKQSIYSFQGAEPRMFAKQGTELGERAGQAGSVWRRVPLTLSFRSVAPLLEAVDAVFADDGRTPGLGSAKVRHEADRTGHAGLIEVWPTEKHEAPASAEPWSPLAETADATPSVVRLANRIADTIAGWLRSGEMLASANRPVRAGDILVLVRKRVPFAPALVSALKARSVPVAGADRLMLTEQIVVQDLMALSDVLLLPDDDLALAAVLKSPLFGLDDDDLMALAHGRSHSLWAQLQAQARAQAGGRLAEAARTLERWRGEAGVVPPFEFFAGVLDSRDGVMPADAAFARLVREWGRPVVLVANKSEGRAGTEGFYEAFQLGLGEPVAISAEHGEGIGELTDTILAALGLGPVGRSKRDGDSDDAAEPEDAPQRPIRVAIVGRPNSGKSTLVNALLGEERMITGPEPGLTRDAVATDFLWNGRAVRLYDTAGLRRKARITETAEKLSASDSVRAIRFAEVVVLLLDAERALEHQDLTIADLVEQEGRAMVVAVNKWDAVADKQRMLKALRESLGERLAQVPGVPFVTLSALSGRGLDRLEAAVFQAYERWNRRVPTPALNRWLTEATERHTPPAAKGRRVKLRFMTQPSARPPTFVAFCSQPQALPKAYLRYLTNSLRETFDLPGVPIRLKLRKGDNPYDRG